MTLDRETPTLSGGESQRVKMVKYLSSNLTGLLYIFDEPSTGLHPHDVYRLNDLLKKIRDKGNTVLVVEHDPDVIPIADYIVDVGPLAGSQGGQIYILDEPTTGLHMSDVSNIIRIIHTLVDKGNTVIVIEHNVDVIKQSDWIIDLGPYGGTEGGRILYEGPPAGMKEVEESITAKYI